MKRAAESPLQPERRVKSRRIDVAEIFAPDNELRTIRTLLEHVDPTQWIGGQIQMAWQFPERIKANLILTSGEKLEVSVVGPTSDNIVLHSGSNIKVSLLGVAVQPSKARSGFLPFTLRFTDRFILQKGDGDVVHWTPPGRASPQPQTPEPESIAALILPQQLVQQRTLHRAEARQVPTPSQPSPSIRTTPRIPSPAGTRAALVAASGSSPSLPEKTQLPPATASQEPPPVHTPAAGGSLRTGPSTSLSTSSPARFDYITCTAAKSAAVSRRISIIGVVTSCGEIKGTRTGEHTRVLYLTDESLSGSDSLYIQCFAKTASLLPSVQTGQLILLRHLRPTLWHGQARAIGYGGTYQWVGYDPEQGEHFVSDPDAQPNADGHFPFHSPSREEVERFVQLADHWRSLQEASPTPSFSQPRPSRQQLLLKDIQPKFFFDCIVEVVGQYLDSRYIVIYVTDYTEHELLRSYDDVNRPHPSGKRVLKVTLWDEQKDLFVDPSGDHYYNLRNVRPKLDSDGVLEAHISGTMQDGIYIEPIPKTDPSLVDLLKRREEYWDAEGERPVPETQAVVVSEPKKATPRIPRPERGRVNCHHMNQPLYTLAELKASEHQNKKYRLRAQVVEFYPHDIMDFVSARCSQCQKPIKDRWLRNCVDCGDDLGRFTKYEFRFTIRVEDTSGETVDVEVAGEDAEAFLDLSPKHLDDHPELVEQLKRNLRIVFGNLVEVHEFLSKDEIVQAKPAPEFDFCVQTWLAPVEKTSGKEPVRSYNLFGCRIVP
ncbi:hypothetical protein BKA62DRAFT_694591 [Auriculariales sp. MPI-PUGE-AT-0066]|nr:hypothetical protein BKA62DRAFT_694591 [Auriculariales sp. MPI-PUGE-AT-0066]